MAKDVIDFIKKFIENHKINLDVDSLKQYLNQDKDNFFYLILSFLSIIELLNGNIMDTFKEILNGKYRF